MFEWVQGVQRGRHVIILWSTCDLGHATHRGRHVIILWSTFDHSVVDMRSDERRQRVVLPQVHASQLEGTFGCMCHFATNKTEK